MAFGTIVIHKIDASYSALPDTLYGIRYFGTARFSYYFFDQSATACYSLMTA
ncbi:hypothetical protein G8759_12745 [Spirosoma aureum]|uniref:Uncharacterized protein n=1 Tax=Spirosoma aureum TaxID=2692134 RepID=A0A6G9AMC5_9BACT|nr:hypothetical protein [Spirosoma aureum]QIP13435.1 hypothetical protein G8759_12745 [Spirosoma aureum]